MRIPPIKFVDKNQIYPSFGLCFKTHIVVRNDLPKSVQKFIIYHETYHFNDTSTNWIWREIKANIYGMIRCPIGFFVTTWLTLFSIDRLRYYKTRWINKV